MYRQTTIRLDATVIEQLKRAARKRAFVNDRPVTWVQLLDEAARRLLRDESESPKERETCRENC